jgi:replication factor C small subunit
MKDLWVDKYRPKTLDGYVLKDQQLKDKVEDWIAQGTIPHILLSGSAGVGKTTLAKLLLNSLGINDNDILYVNGSKEGRKIEWVDRLIMFSSTMPHGDFKVVLIDEADYMGLHTVQPALRPLMEEFSASVRFILTCNYPNRIIPAIHSRCQSIHIQKTDIVEFTARVATILVEENIEFSLDVLDKYVQKYYPDLRKCINSIQLNSIKGKLIDSTSNDAVSDYRIEMVELFQAGRISDARKLICSQAEPEEMEEIYRWLYDHVDIFGDDVKTQEKAICIIKEGLVDHALIIDPEINMAATLIRLSHL